MRSTCLFVLLCAWFTTVNGQLSNASGGNARDLFWCGATTGARTSGGGPAKRSGAPGDAADCNSELRAASKASTTDDQDDRVLTANRITKQGDGTAPRLESSTSRPLGLRYALLARDTATGQYAEVPPSRIFHAGDRVRLGIMPNQPGYLYIIQKGASGSWSALFPKDNSSSAFRPLRAEETYGFPLEENSSFQFDQHAGTERLFLVFMRSPARSVEDVISLVRNSSGRQPETLLSSQNVASIQPSPTTGSGLVSRDLVTTTVDDQGERADKEKAVYVVNRVSTDSKAMIVAYLAITHQ